MELEGAGLGSVARPQPGTTWIVAPEKQLDVRWPDPCYVMTNLVYRRGKFEPFQYTVFIDIIFDCIVDDEPRQFRKRVNVQVDPTNKRAIQL